MRNIFRLFIRHRYTLAFVLIFAVHLFFRLYQFTTRAQLGWDQVDNAWAALRIVEEHKYPLLGMIGKQNSGIFIGPFYYYFVSIFYFLTNLDPIASPVIATVTSVFGFFVLFFVTRTIFGKNVALVAVFINAVSAFIIDSDRVQWPVNFIAPVSLLIFYSLYRIIYSKDYKYSLLLSVATGLMFHIHMTAIFFPIIILLTLPFFPRKRTALPYYAAACVIVLILLAPQIIAYGQAMGVNTAAYLTQNYHGLHFVRVWQLSHDAFIEYEKLLGLRFLRPTVFCYLPLFLFLYFRTHEKRQALVMTYLSLLWFFVPWIVFATYKGELTDYYFSIPRDLVIITVSYLLVRLWSEKQVVLKLCVIALLFSYTILNTQKFFLPHKGNLVEDRDNVKALMRQGRKFEYAEGYLKSYLYHVYKIKHVIPVEEPQPQQYP